MKWTYNKKVNTDSMWNNLNESVEIKIFNRKHKKK